MKLDVGRPLPAPLAALQLAAAFLAAEGRPTRLEVVCLDDRLVTAARREGFRVIDRASLLNP